MIIFILPLNINFIFYCSDSGKFGCSTFARSLIFKFEISAILKFYCSTFWPSSEFLNVELEFVISVDKSLRVPKFIPINDFLHFCLPFWIYKFWARIRNQWPRKPPSIKCCLNQITPCILVGYIGFAILNFWMLSPDSSATPKTCEY